MSDRYTVAVETPDGWTLYEVSDQQIGLLKAGVPPAMVLASCAPAGRSATQPQTAGEILVGADGQVKFVGSY